MKKLTHVKKAPLFVFSSLQNLIFFQNSISDLFQCAPCSMFIAISLSYSGTLLARHLIFIVSWEAADVSMGQHIGNHTKSYRRNLLVFSAERASLIICLCDIPDDLQCHCLSTWHGRCTKLTVLIWKFYYWMWLCISDAPACWKLHPEQQR